MSITAAVQCSLFTPIIQTTTTAAAACVGIHTSTCISPALSSLLLSHSPLWQRRHNRGGARPAAVRNQPRVMLPGAVGVNVRCVFGRHCFVVPHLCAPLHSPLPPSSHLICLASSHLSRLAPRSRALPNFIILLHTLARDSAPLPRSMPLLYLPRGRGQGWGAMAADGVAHVRAVEQRKDTRTLDDTTAASCQGPWCHSPCHSHPPRPTPPPPRTQQHGDGAHARGAH